MQMPNVKPLMWDRNHQSGVDVSFQVIVLLKARERNRSCLGLISNLMTVSGCVLCNSYGRAIHTIAIALCDYYYLLIIL